jgi:hypothetical protein
MGDNINSAMRLCAVALINNEVTHAEVARCGIDYWRSDVAPTCLSRGYVEEPHLIGTFHERAIARCMLKLMDSVYSIAIESAAIATANINAPRRSTTGILTKYEVDPRVIRSDDLL